MSNGLSAEKIAQFAQGTNLVPVLSGESMEGLEIWLEVLFANRVISVLLRLAENPRTPGKLLDSLANQTNSDLRVAVAENPSCPSETLERLAADTDPDVRYAIAENHNMPWSILHLLTGDENPYVSCRAIRTLDRLQGFSILQFPSAIEQQRVTC